MIKIQSISSIVYYVHDLDVSAKFYEALGFRPGDRTDTTFKVYVNWFAIEFRVADEQVDNQRSGAYTGIKVDDADEYREFAVSKGLDNVGKVTDRPGKIREFVVTDPDGYQLLFFSKK